MFLDAAGPVQSSARKLNNPKEKGRRRVKVSARPTRPRGRTPRRSASLGAPQAKNKKKKKVKENRSRASAALPGAQLRHLEDQVAAPRKTAERMLRSRASAAASKMALPRTRLYGNFPGPSHAPRSGGRSARLMAPFREPKPTGGPMGLRSRPLRALNIIFCFQSARASEDAVARPVTRPRTP